MILTGSISQLKSKNGRTYFGIEVDKDTASSFLLLLEKLLNPDEFSKVTKNQRERDNQHHHLTIIGPNEYEVTDEGEFTTILEKKVQFSALGIGLSSKGTDYSYFAIIDSPDLTRLRNQYNLPPRDFHITLGFSKKDVQGVLKDESTMILKIPEEK